MLNERKSRIFMLIGDHLFIYTYTPVQFTVSVLYVVNASVYVLNVNFHSICMKR